MEVVPDYVVTDDCQKSLAEILDLTLVNHDFLSGLRVAKLSKNRDLLHLLIDSALSENDFYSSIQAAILLKDEELVRSICQQALVLEPYESFVGYSYLKDTKGILDSAVALDIKLNRSAADDIIYNMFQPIYDRVKTQFKEWSRANGYKENSGLEDMPGTAGAALNCAKSYDVGIAVAKGGLFPAYIFEKFRLPITIVEWHRDQEDTDLEWRNNYQPNQLNKSRVLVLETDVHTGSTSQRVYDEIIRHDPKSVDIFTSAPPGDSIHTIVKNILIGYQTHIHAKSYSVQDSINGVRVLEKLL